MKKKKRAKKPGKKLSNNSATKRVKKRSQVRDAAQNAPMGNGELPPATLPFANEKATSFVL